MSFDILDNLSIKLIDGDRGKNYPKQSDFFDKSDCLFLSAKNVTKAGFEFTDCSFISKEKDQQLRAGKLERNDIVLTTRGTIGNSALYDSSVSISSVRINSGMIILRPDTNIWNPRFLYFLLNSDFVLQQISALTSGSAVPQLPARDLKKFILPRVSLDKQHKIVEIIGSIVDKIRVSKAINQTLEQMAQALFKSWFVDFEPVKAKIAVLEAGGSQEDATLAAMTSISGKDEDALAVFEREHPEQYAELKATAELFPSAMQDSELGEIPVGWESSPLSNKIKLTGGGTPKRSEPTYWDGNICWYSVKDAPNEGDVFVIDTVEKITKKGLDKSSTKILPIGTTIISARGTVGKLALTAVEMTMNQSCYGISGGEFSGPFLTYLKVKQCVDVLKRNTHGAVFDTITTSTFETVVTLTASKAVNHRFEKIVTPLFSVIENNLRTNACLTQLRDTLLPKLLSGEITLPEAEQIISEEA
ncbi:restriction endonuclease subunit S [Salmonella enterica]|nr:restriction endonuclease subunit S [Salmonella enterica]EBF5000023.1 restriction endonuclease subunit S [Salmonella enterica]EBI4207135.1 restriction endonuclease subunit S [Salmonella enterica]